MKKPLLYVCTVATLLGLVAASGAAQPAAQPVARPAPTTRTLEFIENKGQWNERARYAAPLPGGGRLFAEADGLTLALLADGGPAQRGHGAPPGGEPAASRAVRGHALTLHFEGARPATITAETPTAEHRSYFLGADSKRWARDARSFRALRYAGLWPGVNARVYESADQHLEYDFELAPGARPAAIALRHEGADGLALDAAGNLLVRTSVGTVVERAPRAWQTDAAGRPQPVACRYELAGRIVRFALGRYDAARPLTIDPVVVFATYSGSTADNWGFTATHDEAGNLYSGGIAFGVGYPASPGAFQTTFAALIDIAIIKYNTAATGPAARAWATYVGGSGADFPHSLVVNNQGELLLLGSSGSANYPTTATALQPAFAGGTLTEPLGYGTPYDSPSGSDLVITRLNATGTALVGSTYLGGRGNDGLLPLAPDTSAFSATPQLAHNYGDPFRGDILVDAADNVYIASHTTSSDFPVARGFDGSYNGGPSDGVVCRLAPDLSALAWGSYLGGAGADAAYSLQIEPASGDVYAAGGTLSPNFPTTPGAYRGSRPGNVDGFVARIAASGASLLRASYVGTAAYDQAYFLQLGTDGGVYLLGQTLGAFPVTPGLYGTPNGTQFIQKLDANLGQSLLATAFGSTAPDNAGRGSLNPTAFLVDRCDRVYVCGWGGQVNGWTIGQPGATFPYLEGNGNTLGLPTTPDAAQPATDGSDFYLAQFAAGLTALAYATYYGNANPDSEAEHVDGGTSRFDPRGIVYQAVCSCFARTGFPIPAGANTYSTTNNSGASPNVSCNNAAFVLNFQPNIANAGADQAVCATAGPQPLVGSPGGGVWTGPGVTGSPAQGFVFTPSVALAGGQVLTYTVLSTGLCTTTDTRRVTVGAPPTVVFTPLLQTAYCPPGPGAPPLPAVPLTATPPGGTFSGPGVSGSVAAGFVFAPGSISPGTVQLVYTLDVDGCVVQATRAVTVAPRLVASAGADTALCPGSTQAFALRGSPAGGTFSGPGVSGSAAAGFVFTPPAGFAAPVTLTYAVSSGGCLGSATRRVSVAPEPALLPAWAPVACPEARLAPLALRFTLISSINFSNPTLVWEFGDGSQSTEASPTHTYAGPGTYQPRLRLRYNDNRCETTAAAPLVVVTERRIPNIITPNGDDQNQTFRLGSDCAPRLEVFSRWGQRVFEAAAYRDEWSAADQPAGVYYYLLTYPDGHRAKGWVEVVR
ncbi:gliding motility-associated C-terminal domain-containing protein [Hymenobacter sp.]|uniref:DUF7948 domain-containing protein n=1 Tax=Hymenobacter sp. TaxID=1898978 RepID=UPI00286C8F23|nr:gliding motility-associated C-terminal domain-containing protein [Hymenobacter sp.]